MNYLKPEEPPVRSRSAILDNCGRALLPLDKVFLSLTTQYGCVYSISTVVHGFAGKGKVFIRLNEAIRRVFQQLGCDVSEVIPIDGALLIRAPSDSHTYAELRMWAFEIMVTTKLDLDYKALLNVD